MGDPIGGPPLAQVRLGAGLQVERLAVPFKGEASVKEMQVRQIYTFTYNTVFVSIQIPVLFMVVFCGFRVMHPAVVGTNSSFIMLSISRGWSHY